MTPPGVIWRDVYDDDRGLVYYAWDAAGVPGWEQPGLQQETGHALPEHDGWYLYGGEGSEGDGPYTEAEGLQLLWEAGPAEDDDTHTTGREP